MPDRYKPFPPRWRNIQVPISSRAAALGGISLWSPCRPVALRAQQVAWAAVRLGGPRLLPGAARPWQPPLPPAVWSELCETWRAEVGPFEATAVYERRQGGRGGLCVLLVGEAGPVAFAKVRPGPQPGEPDPLRPDPLRMEEQALAALSAAQPRSFWHPAALASGSCARWRYVAMSTPPPGLDRPLSDPPLAVVLADVQRSLALLPRPDDLPGHWEPMHGDLTPWNLRRAGARMRLVDWEDAGWGPPGADEVLYRATASALWGTPIQPGPAEAVGHWLTTLAARPPDAADTAFRGALTAVLRRMEPATHRGFVD